MGPRWLDTVVVGYLRTEKDQELPGRLDPTLEVLQSGMYGSGDSVMRCIQLCRRPSLCVGPATLVLLTRAKLDNVAVKVL
jgi:hypothetical protein